jgi:hypothetical protein
MPSINYIRNEQLAHYNGYIWIETWIRIDLIETWNSLKKNLIKERINKYKMQEFVEENVVLATGFVGGFLLGLSSA